MLKDLTGIHLVTKGAHGHCQENRGLSLLVTAVIAMMCPMSFFHSHWHTEILPETFSSKHFGSPALKPLSGAQCACALMLAEMLTPVCTCPKLPRDPQQCSVLQLKLWNTQACSMEAFKTHPHLKYQPLSRTTAFCTIPAHVKYIPLLQQHCWVIFPLSCSQRYLTSAISAISIVLHLPPSWLTTPDFAFPLFSMVCNGNDACKTAQLVIHGHV